MLFNCMIKIFDGGILGFFPFLLLGYRRLINRILFFFICFILQLFMFLNHNLNPAKRTLLNKKLFEIKIYYYYNIRINLLNFYDKYKIFFRNFL